MTFSRVKPFGWTVGELLQSDEQNALDVDHTLAIDGGGGGSYTVANDLTISSQPTKNVTLNRLVCTPLSDGGTVVCQSGLSVQGNIGASGEVAGGTFHSEGVAQIDGVLTTLAAASIGGALTVAGATTINGFTNMTAGGQVEGGFAVSGGETVTGAFSVSGRSIFNDRICANAGIRFRSQNLGTIGTSVSRSVDSADIFYIPDSTVSSLNFTIIDPTVTTSEDTLWVSIVWHSVNSCVVKDPSNVSLITLTYQSGSPFAVNVFRIGGSWIIGAGTSYKP